jgi:putative transposase
MYEHNSLKNNKPNLGTKLVIISSRMPRTPRQFTHELPYHVACRCNNKNFYFQDPFTFELYKTVLTKSMQRMKFQIYAYVLMSNHIHLVLQTSPLRSLDTVMHHINLNFSKKYNKLRGRCGHLWMNRYGAKLISSPEYLIATMRYVMKNPIRAGIVTDLNDWPWSSYHFYCGNKHDPLVTPAPLNLIDESLLRHRYYNDLLSQTWPSDNT